VRCAAVVDRSSDTLTALPYVPLRRPSEGERANEPSLLPLADVEHALDRLLAHEGTYLVVCDIDGTLASTCMLGVTPSLAVPASGSHRTGHADFPHYALRPLIHSTAPHRRCWALHRAIRIRSVSYSRLMSLVGFAAVLFAAQMGGAHPWGSLRN
jgi:hypothetical protein